MLEKHLRAPQENKLQCHPQMEYYREVKVNEVELHPTIWKSLSKTTLNISNTVLKGESVSPKTRIPPFRK